LGSADVDAGERGVTEIDGAWVGFLGTSQAGWVVPLAVVRSLHRVAFTALADAPAVTTGEEQQWSQLAGEDAASPPPLTAEKKAEITRQLQPSGFDPVPLLKQMTVPGIWVYGREDRSQPAEKSAATLERLRQAEGKDFTVVLFPPPLLPRHETRRPRHPARRPGRDQASEPPGPAEPGQLCDDLLHEAHPQGGGAARLDAGGGGDACRCPVRTVPAVAGP
jgi:hypothetical protein